MKKKEDTKGEEGSIVWALKELKCKGVGHSFI